MRIPTPVFGLAPKSIQGNTVLSMINFSNVVGRQCRCTYKDEKRHHATATGLYRS